MDKKELGDVKSSQEKSVLKPCSSVAGHPSTCSHNLENKLLKYLLTRSLSDADFTNIKYVQILH